MAAVPAGVLERLWNSGTVKRLWGGLWGWVKFPWGLVPSPVRRAHDPVVALALWALALAGIAAIVGSACRWHFELVKMLPVLGSVVVLLGSYFAARTLRDNEVAKATEMLGSSELPIRVAGVHQLGLIGMNVPRFRKYAQLTLCGFVETSSDPNDKSSVEFAKDVLRQLQPLARSEIAVLDVEVGKFFPRTNPDLAPCGSDADPDS